MRSYRFVPATLAVFAGMLPAAAQIVVPPPSEVVQVLPSQTVPDDPFGGRLVPQDLFAAAARDAALPAVSQIRVLKRVKPFYPYKLVREGGDDANPVFKPMRDAGRAEVSVLVGISGQPRLVSVREATQNSFGLTAAEAALQFEFEPLVIDGKPREFQVVVPFSFKPADAPVEDPAGGPPPEIRLPAAK